MDQRDQDQVQDQVQDQEGVHNDEHSKPSKKTSETWEWIKALGIAVIIAVVIRTFLFAPIVVDGESMLPTLEDDERLIINKAVYLIKEPQRGDIIVFHAAENKDWIKRVIGEPGDLVEVRDDVLFINNIAVDEPYLDSLKAGSRGVLTHDFYEEVPENHLFVMGDNRLNSRDSRYVGSIPIDSVIGRADVAIWPLSSIRWMDH